MDLLTHDDLRSRAEATADPAVSIYMPTFRAGREVRQNAIRFKNLIDQTEERLNDFDVNATPRNKLVETMMKLLPDDDWWQHQSDGLAMFAAPAESATLTSYRLPLDFQETVVVGERYHVRPLVRLLQGDGRFYVIAVSQNDVRLLEGSHYSVDEVDLEALPKDLRSALRIDEYVSSLQHHAEGIGRQSEPATMFHGHGGSDLDVKKKDEITQYFRHINAALDGFLADKRAPLVFAGVDYLFPLFRETCDYRHLVDKPVEGNPDEQRADQLHGQAWAVVEPIFDKARNNALARYNDLSSGETATNEVVDIVRAARQGAVDTLLLAEGSEKWGVIDESQPGPVIETARDAEGAVDLLNDAAIHTLASSGQVYSLAGDRLNGECAAVLRYPLPASV